MQKQNETAYDCPHCGHLLQIETRVTNVRKGEKTLKDDTLKSRRQEALSKEHRSPTKEHKMEFPSVPYSKGRDV